MNQPNRISRVLPSVVAAATKEKLAQAGDGSNTRSVLADAAVKASVEADFLKDPDLSVLKIDVDSKDGVVTLNGLTKDETARAHAAQIAQNVKGVHEVRNFLVVKRT